MDKVVEVVSGGPVITGPTPSSFSVRQTYLCGSRKPFQNTSKIIQILKKITFLVAFCLITIQVSFTAEHCTIIYYIFYPSDSHGRILYIGDM